MFFLENQFLLLGNCLFLLKNSVDFLPIDQELVVCDAASDRDSCGATEVRGVIFAEHFPLKKI